ncbi:hypothetical protein Hypma_008188 [Hypsizygus marmoreus]|uniref:Reverse transcriptase domain-containing protein n=1 Tax=Hypsizygus marmoreus TaxID=39966 RepID=A0A369JTF5_HYPMA|nr:hypothetical protein Hypma_008188 [Hypsizygus marmoreus]
MASPRRPSSVSHRGYNDGRLHGMSSGSSLHYFLLTFPPAQDPREHQRSSSRRLPSAVRFSDQPHGEQPPSRRPRARHHQSLPLDPSHVIILERIAHILQAGWPGYIPLTVLSNAACRLAGFAPVRPNPALHVSAHGSLQLCSPHLDCSKEMDITCVEWLQAGRNLVRAIRKNLVLPEFLSDSEDSMSSDSPPLADDVSCAFDAHFMGISTRADFESNFSVYVEYDIFIRRQWLVRLQNGSPLLDIQHFHDKVYDSYDRAKTSCTVNTLTSSSSKTFHDRATDVTHDRASSRRSDSSWSRPVDRSKLTETASRPAACTVAPPTTISAGVLAPVNSSPKAKIPGGNLPTAQPSVLGTMAPPPAPSMIRAPTPMLAPSAVDHITVLRTAQCELHFPISTPHKHWRWTALLEEVGGLEQFAEVPKGLQFGFSLGLEDFVLDSTFSPPNHYKSPEHHAFIQAKYAEGTQLGRVSPGYTPALATELFGFYRTAPLNVSEQKPGKLRITVDHSFPRNNPLVRSVNSQIDSSKFRCDWGTFSACWLLVADAPPGTEACVFDVDTAFHNIPTRPTDRPATALLIDGLVRFDGRLNFGISPAPGIFGLVADAIVFIYLNKGIDALIKWVDDFIFFRYRRGFKSDGSPVFAYDESLIWSIADDLGWPWAPDKFVPFSTSFTYIGFNWSIEEKTVSLPDHKHAKYLAKLELWNLGAYVNLRSTESLIGTLNHVTLVIPNGCSHLPELYKFRAAFPVDAPPWCQHRVTPSVFAAIAWWRETLSTSWCSLHIVRPPEPLSIPIFVDASTSWGIGFYMNGKWLAWKLRPGWKSDDRDIGWAEMVAVDLALHAIIASGLRDCHLVINSDNTGVVGALSTGRSRNSQQNAILRRIVENFQAHGIWLTLNWIPTTHNIADAPSRGLFPPKKLLFPYPPAIPTYLKPLITPSVPFHDLTV